MIQMIKSSDIIKLLKDKSADLSKEEIEKIIENELLKDESEMDADLIEFCLDALKEKENTPKKKKLSYFKITALVAAAAVLTFIITAVIPKLTERSFNNTNIVNSSTSETKKVTTTIPKHTTTENRTEKAPVTEKLSSDNVPTETKPAPSLKGETTKAPSCDKGFSTVVPEESFESALKKLLAVNGFDSVSLPKRIFENSEILNKSFEGKKAEIRIKSKEKIFDITLEKSSEKIEEKNVIDVNGINVSVESKNNSSEIIYRKNNLNYRIVFESSYEEAVRIAKTIC